MKSNDIDCSAPLSLRLRDIFTSLKQEQKAFWFLVFYFFIEYIRPQSMYRWLDVLPWGLFSLALVGLAVVYFHEKPGKKNSIDFLMFFFVAWVVVTIPFAWNTDVSLKYWTTIGSWAVMYYCVIAILTSRSRIILFYLLFILINLKMSEYGARKFALRGFSFASWGLSGPPGWFRNSGEFSMQMVVIFSMATSILLTLKEYISSEYRWWFLMLLFPGTAFLSVVGSSSRGGQIALAAVILFLFLRGKYFFRKILALVLLSYLVLLVLPEEQVQRFSTMGEDNTSRLRLLHWKNAAEVFDQNPFGIGYMNWLDYYQSNFIVEKYEEIHNTGLQVLVELGYIGGAIFFLLLFVSFASNKGVIKRCQKDEDICSQSLAAIARGLNLALFGAVIASMFMSVLYYPVFWVSFALSSALKRASNAKKEAGSKLFVENVKTWKKAL